MHQKSYAKHDMTLSKYNNKLVMKRLPLMLINCPPIARLQETVHTVMLAVKMFQIINYMFVLLQQEF